MYDYRPMRFYKSEDQRTTTLGVYHTNLICKVFDKYKHKGSPSFLDNSHRPYNLVHVMRDGIIAEKLADKTSFIQYPWAEIDYVDISNGMLSLKPSNDSSIVRLLPDVDHQDNVELVKKWPIYVARDEIPKTVPLVNGTPLAESKPRKKWWKIALVEVFVALLIFLGVTNFLRGGEPSLCEGRAKYLAGQMPQVLDILSGRYPLRVGLLRSYLNENGAADTFVQQFVRVALSGSKDNPFVCAKDGIAFRLNGSSTRVQMADELEKELGLK